MNQFPYMPLYWNDLLSDNKVRVMSNEELGAYIRLLGVAWHEDIPGTIPSDDDVLARFAGVELSLWRKLSRRILPCFVLNSESGRYEQKRMMTEHAKVADASVARKDRATAGALGKWGSLDQQNRMKRSERLTAARQIATHCALEWTALLQVVPACARCGAEGKMVKDHIKPIYKGGSDGIENLQPLCGTCNSSKGPDETDFRPDGWREHLDACLSRHQAGIKQAKTPASQNQSQSNSPHNARGDEDGSEIPDRQTALGRAANQGIPADFAGMVFDTWITRRGRDFGGNPVDYLPYVIKRWTGERLEWEDGTHKSHPNRNKKNGTHQKHPGISDRNANLNAGTSGQYAGHTIVDDR